MRASKLRIKRILYNTWFDFKTLVTIDLMWQLNFSLLFNFILKIIVCDMR